MLTKSLDDPDELRALGEKLQPSPTKVTFLEKAIFHIKHPRLETKEQILEFHRKKKRMATDELGQTRT
jgi:hypothetical protein